MKGSHLIFDTKCLDRDHKYSVQWCLLPCTSRIFRSRFDVNSPDARVLTCLNFQNKNFVKTYLSSLVRSHLQHEIQNLTVSSVGFIKKLNLN